MKTPALLFGLILCGCSVGENKTLGEKLADTTVAHIKSHGPDKDVQRFVAMERFTSLDRHEEIANATLPYLGSKKPDVVAGALGVLYRLRADIPGNDSPQAQGREQRRNEARAPDPFIAHMDAAVLNSVEHVHALRNVMAMQNLALYLGVCPTDEAKRELLRIAAGTSRKEQALICLAWHGNPKDMDTLLPFMLEESDTVGALPHTFRTCYGVKAIPYLEKAVAEAKSETTRREAAKELEILRAEHAAEQKTSDSLNLLMNL